MIGAERRVEVAGALKMDEVAAIARQAGPVVDRKLEHGKRGGREHAEQASAQVQGVLQNAPRTAEFAVPGTLRIDMEKAAQRFGQLRQAVLRAQAQSQRAVKSILPQTAQPTYGAMAGRAYGSTGGAGPGYLRA